MQQNTGVDHFGVQMHVAVSCRASAAGVRGGAVGTAVVYGAAGVFQQIDQCLLQALGIGIDPQRLFDLVGVIAATPGYFRKHGVPRSPADLAQHECIRLKYLTGKTFAWEFQRQAEVFAFEPRGALTVSDPEAACELALQGLGLASVGLHHALPHLRSGRLQCALIDWQRPARTLYLHYPHREHLAPRVRVLVEHVVKGFGSHPGLQWTQQELAGFVAGGDKN